MRHGALSVVLLLGSVNAACGGYRPPPVTLAPEVAGAAPTQVWAARAGRRLSGRLAVNGETLYGAGVDRKVYAVDLASGAIRWSSRLSGLIAGGVLLSGDTVFAASSRPEGRVYALDAATGRRHWRAKTGPVGAPLALVGGTLLVATQRGDLMGLNPATGERRWRRRLGSARVAPLETEPGTTILATVDSIFQVRAVDGTVSRRVPSPGTVVSPWLLHGGLLVAGTTDSQVVAIDPADLSSRWNVRLDAPVLDSPAARGDTVFAASRRGTLYRIHPGSDPRAEPIVELEWPITSPVTIVEDQILLGGADGIMRALRSDGTEIWRVQLWRPVELGPIVLDDGIVAIGGAGDLHRFRQ